MKYFTTLPSFGLSKKEIYKKELSEWLGDCICNALDRGHSIEEIACVLQIPSQLIEKYRDKKTQIEKPEPKKRTPPHTNAS